MARRRWTSARALVAILGGSIAPQLAHAATPPTDAQVEALIEHIQKAGAGETDVAKRSEAKRDAARRELTTLSISEATWSQIDSIHKRVGTASPELAAALEARTGALASEALDDPGIAERLNTGKADGVVAAIARLRVSTLAAHRIIDRLAPLITPDLPPKTVMILDGMARQVAGHRAELGDRPVDLFRTNLVAAIAIAHPKRVAERQERLKKAAAQAQNNPNAQQLAPVLNEYNAREQCELDKMLQTRDLLSGPWARGQLLDHPAPDLKLIWSSSQQPIRTWSDLAGKVVLIEFWWTSSEHSIASFSSMRDLQKRYAGFPVVLLGVTSEQGAIQHWKDGRRTDRIDCAGNPDKEHAAMVDFMRAQQITWTIAYSAKPAINPDFGVAGVPELAIVDPKGVVRFAGMLVNGKDHSAKIDTLLREAGLPCPACRP